MRSVLGASWKLLLDLVLPRHCVVCAAPCTDGLVCRACDLRMGALPHPQCARCGDPSPAALRECRTCAALAPSIQRARSWTWADDPVAREMVHGLKYDGWEALALPIAGRMARLRPDDGDPRHRCLVPVPLTAERSRQRGYNQAGVLCEALGRLWQCTTCPDVLRRTRETPSQTRLTRVDRFDNVANAFQVNVERLRDVAALRCVLVDDVLTTGATLSACAQALGDVGIETISCVTFGRARAPREATLA